MIVLEESINNLFREIIGSLLLLPGIVIKAKQKNAPKPSGEYVEVNIFSIERLGLDVKSYEDDIVDVSEEIEGLRELTISISFYRGEAMDNASKVQIGFFRESIQSILRESKIGYTSTSNIRDLSEALENGWEKRAQFDVVLNTVYSDIDIVRAINTLSINDEIYDLTVTGEVL